MDITLLKELIREFKDSELTKLELNYQGLEIKLENKQEVSITPSVMQPQIAQPQMIQTPIVQTGTNGSSACAITSPEVKSQTEGHMVTSPMVGTVYTAPGPDAPPFVTVGQRVKKGDIVCIIEAMKLMNEVEADIDGEIVEVLIQNEGMVQFGEPLVVIRP